MGTIYIYAYLSTESYVIIIYEDITYVAHIAIPILFTFLAYNIQLLYSILNVCIIYFIRYTFDQFLNFVCKFYKIDSKYYYNTKLFCKVYNNCSSKKSGHLYGLILYNIITMVKSVVSSEPVSSSF